MNIISQGPWAADFEKNPKWNTKIDPSIKIGVATSDYQINGAENFKKSTWAQFEEMMKKDGTPCIAGGDKSGKALDFWNNPEELITRLKESGFKDYRFSVEWSAIFPEKGVFFQEAMDKYVYICKRLLQEGIEPVVTLHHFSDPIWFKDQGGFEREENIEDFVAFTKIVYENLSPFVEHWMTFNEPTIYAFGGWVRGVFPPGEIDLQKFGMVLKHMLIAQDKVYDALKELDVDNKSKIAITHQALCFRPNNEWNPIEVKTCEYLTKITHRCLMDYYLTGEYNFYIPFVADVSYSNPNVKNKYDFFGVQYYTIPLISMVFNLKVMDSICKENQKMTGMPFRFYPEGLAPILEELGKLKKPIWITETGEACNPPEDADEDKDEVKAIRRAVHKAFDGELEEEKLVEDIRKELLGAFLEYRELKSYQNKPLSQQKFDDINLNKIIENTPKKPTLAEIKVKLIAKAIQGFGKNDVEFNQFLRKALQNAILENQGEKDQKEFIKKALKVASFAKSKGVDIERVYLWTLADNFEWDMGWEKWFGLYSFDPETRKYVLRPAGTWVKKLLELREQTSKTMESKEHFIKI